MDWLKYFFGFVLLVFLQIVLLNRIHFWGYATPLLYIYFILKLPVGMKEVSVLFIAASIGLIIDFFNYTLGLNMLACTIIGFCQPYFVCKLFSPRDATDSFVPSLKTLGFLRFAGYAALLTLIHHLALFAVESFSFLDITVLLIRIGSSFIFTLALILLVDLIFLKK